MLESVRVSEDGSGWVIQSESVSETVGEYVW